MTLIKHRRYNKAMKIEVTKSDIRYGVKQAPRKCALARALKRAGFLDPSIGWAITVGPVHQRRQYPLTTELNLLIERFDSGVKIEPATVCVPGLRKPRAVAK